MKVKGLLAGIAFGTIAAIGMTTGAQAAVGIYLDTGDYWRHHRYDYCYYHNCGDLWYERHHRHHWHDRNLWRRGFDHRGWRHHGHGYWGDRPHHGY